MCTCINCNGDISLPGTCVVENQQPEWSVTWTPCSLAFFFVCDDNLYCARWLPQGFSLKN